MALPALPTPITLLAPGAGLTLQALADRRLLADLDAGKAATVLLGLDRIRTAAPHDGPDLDPTSVAGVLGLRHTGLRFLVAQAAHREHPWNIARATASLDHWLDGRSGLVLAGEDHFAPAGRADVPAVAWDPGALAPAVEAGAETTFEAASIIRALWGSYPNSALVVDRERRVFADDTDIHPIDHEGRYRVRGPLSVASSFHGEPLLALYVERIDDLDGAPAAVDLGVVPFELRSELVRRVHLPKGDPARFERHEALRFGLSWRWRPDDAVAVRDEFLRLRAEHPLFVAIIVAVDEADELRAAAEWTRQLHELHERD